MQHIDLVGKRFHRLLVIEKTNDRTKERQVIWLCKCDCGKIVRIRTSGLKNTKSCRCLQKEVAANMKRTHGMSTTRLHGVWADMKARCDNPNSANYKHYGGRGITYDPRWEKFENFLEDMKSTYKEGLELDRTDNDKGYYKENCHWIKRIEQMQNIRTNRLITFNGKTRTRTQWAQKIGLGLTNDIIRSRIDKYGWSIEKALTIPNMKKYN